MTKKKITVWREMCFAIALSIASMWFSFGAMQDAVAAELLMFEAKDCAICRTFNLEVGIDYDSSKSSGVLPLRRIDIHSGKVDVKLKQAVIMTPTFVFVDQGAEIARFVGYPGRKIFFMLVDGAAEELIKAQAKRSVR